MCVYSKLLRRSFFQLWTRFSTIGSRKRERDWQSSVNVSAGYCVWNVRVVVNSSVNRQLSLITHTITYTDTITCTMYASPNGRQKQFPTEISGNLRDVRLRRAKVAHTRRRNTFSGMHRAPPKRSFWESEEKDLQSRKKNARCRSTGSKTSIFCGILNFITQKNYNCAEAASQNSYKWSNEVTAVEDRGKNTERWNLKRVFLEITFLVTVDMIFEKQNKSPMFLSCAFLFTFLT